MILLALVRFESPGYLALLALLPLLVVLSYRSLAGLGPVRRGVALAARCLVVLVAVLALAGAQRSTPVKDLSAVFLFDRSKSIPTEVQREALRYVAGAAEGRKGDDLIGVVGFDGVADVQQRPMRTLEITDVPSPGVPDQTSIARAARLALALLPSDTTGRVVLMSDGNENVGDILQEAEQFRAAGIPVDVLPVQYEHAGEVVFEQLKAPPTATAEETVNLQMVIRAQQATSGQLLLWHNENLLDLNGPAEGGGFSVQLDAGPNRLQIPVPLRVAGAHRFRAQFVPGEASLDTIEDNNTGRAFTVVSGQGEILILTTKEDLLAEHPSAAILAAALQREQLVCQIKLPGEIPAEDLQTTLLGFSAVVLDNVPASDFPESWRQALAVYVRDLGGGLVMLGGENSFGAGGWLGSPVEEVMPVNFDIKHKKEFLKGGLVLVMHACEIPDGNYLGIRAAKEAVTALSSRDAVGVLSWQWQGGTEKDWVVPLQDVGTKRAILNAIEKMSMGDLPDLDPLMRAGAEALIKRTDIGPKHMIVVSDFDPQSPRQDLIDAMKRHGVQCTTIAIGYGGHMIDEGKAQWIADSTGGRFYRTNDHSQLPQIFIKEAREVRRSLVQESPFTPQVAERLSPLLAGLTGGVPELGGLVLTSAKDAAQTPLVRASEELDDKGKPMLDPVLAHWQVGLGKSIAFTSGLWPKWGSQWVSWESYSKFWAQAIRWVSRQSEAAAFDISTSVQGGKARVRIDAVDKNAAAVNFMTVAGQCVTPGQTVKELRLTQTAPGRYEVEFDARERGNYIINLKYASGTGATAQSGTFSTGLTVAYSPEYSQLRPNLPLLEEVRERTGGRRLDPATPRDVFDRAGIRTAERRQSLWETLVRWMLLLFLIDVAVRRVAISPAELARKARRLLEEMAGRGRPPAATEAVLSTLKGTRERVRDERTAGGGAPGAGEAGGVEGRPAPTARYEARTPDTKATEELGRALGGATQQDVPVVAKPTAKKPAQTEADYTSRLLKAKRRARQEMEKDEGKDDQAGGG